MIRVLKIFRHKPLAPILEGARRRGNWERPASAICADCGDCFGRNAPVAPRREEMLQCTVFAHTDHSRHRQAKSPTRLSHGIGFTLHR
jgi:hypothetical protein